MKVFTSVINITALERGYVMAHEVEAPHYKPEGHSFDSCFGHWNFSMT
jgi:hypothetical protein